MCEGLWRMWLCKVIVCCLDDQSSGQGNDPDFFPPWPDNFRISIAYYLFILGTFDGLEQTDYEGDHLHTRNIKFKKSWSSTSVPFLHIHGTETLHVVCR